MAEGNIVSNIIFLSPSHKRWINKSRGHYLSISFTHRELASAGWETCPSHHTAGKSGVGKSQRK